MFVIKSVLFSPCKMPCLKRLGKVFNNFKSNTNLMCLGNVYDILNFENDLLSKTNLSKGPPKPLQIRAL